MGIEGDDNALPLLRMRMSPYHRFERRQRSSASFPIPSAGPSDGNLCVKGRFGWDFIDHPERMKTPLLKVNGEFREASWDEALRLVATEFERIKNQSGPNAIAGILSSRLTNEEYYLSKIVFQ